MKTNIILTLGLFVLTLGFIGCGAPAANTTNANAKPANANTANANMAAANTATAPATDGQVIKIDEAGIQMTVPKGFKFSKDGEDMIVKTEDEGVEVRFTVPKDGDYDKARVDAAKEIDTYIKDVKIEQKDKKEDVNGMEGLIYSGTGIDREDGKHVDWDMTLIKTDKKPVLVISYAEEASMMKNASALSSFFMSVKKQ